MWGENVLRYLRGHKVSRSLHAHFIEFNFIDAFHSGATPQVIGEASLLLARACFPDANISGSLGHGPADVACKLLLDNYSHHSYLTAHFFLQTSYLEMKCLLVSRTRP